MDKLATKDKRKCHFRTLPQNFRETRGKLPKISAEVCGSVSAEVIPPIPPLVALPHHRTLMGAGASRHPECFTDLGA